MEGVRMGLGVVSARDRPIARGGPGGAEKWKPSRRGSVYLENAKRWRERAEGDPMEGARMSLNEVGARDRLIARGGAGWCRKMENRAAGARFCQGDG